MKKEDLLLVFDFLATALKQDVVEEKQVEPVKEIYEDYDYVGNVLHKKLDPEPAEPIKESVPEPEEPVKNDVTGFLREFKVHPDKIKTLMGKVSKEVISVPEDKLTRMFKEQERNLSNYVSKVHAELRDSMVSEEDKKAFKNFVNLDLIDAKQRLKAIDKELTNQANEKVSNKKNLIKKESEEQLEEDEPKIYPKAFEKPNPFESVDSNGMSRVISESTLPGEIKKLMSEASKIMTSNEVRFKDEFKNGLGSDKNNL